MGNETEDKKDEAAELNKKEFVEFSSNMSLLLANFSSASLLSSSSSHKVQSECGCHDIVSTLKAIHIHRPISGKHRLRRLLKRFKQSSHGGRNHQNLAVAACCHLRPLLWPGRLSRNRRSQVSRLIHPARLKYHPKSDSQDPGVSARKKSSTSFQLNCEVVDSLRSNTSLNLTSVHSSRTDEATSVHALFGSKAVFGGSPTELPSTFRDLSSSQQAGTALRSETPLHHSGLYRSPASAFAASRRRHSSSARSSRVGRSNAVAAQRALTVGLPGHTSSALDSTAASLQSALPESEGGPLSLSCSQEVRMEETNVNELASYLEDFLHIPRKMSTMAEMMYA